MTDFLQNAVIREDMENIYRSGDYAPLKGKTVLITGAYGMLASYMVCFPICLNYIHDYDVKVISLSRSAEKFNARFGIYTTEVERIEQSVNGPVSIACDYIVHAASFASPQYYTLYPVDVVLPNMLGTYYMLELALSNGAKMLYFSTCSVYGLFLNHQNPVGEADFGTLDPLDPHSCYDESKRAGETLCAAYCRQKGVAVVIARIAHTYEPTMDIENDPRVFSSFVKNAVKGEDIEIKSDGLQKRSFCYLSDAATAYFKLLLNGSPGEAYNVCNAGQTVTIRAPGKIISKLANVKFIYKKREEGDRYLQDENVCTTVYSSGKLEALGFSFNTDITSGFKRVMESCACPPPQIAIWFSVFVICEWRAAQ